MRSRMAVLLKWLFLIGTGGFMYWKLEMLVRGRSHWTMALVGGICFFLCGMLNEKYPGRDMPLLLQGLAGSAIITAVEFVSGCIINIWLGLDVWNYSNLPCNILGQICLPFSLLWILAAIAAIIIDDLLRLIIFDEDMPEYRLL